MMLVAGRAILLWMIIGVGVCSSCKKDTARGEQAPLRLDGVTVNEVVSGFEYTDVGTFPVIRLKFSAAIDRSTADQGIMLLKNGVTAPIPIALHFQDGDRAIEITPEEKLSAFSNYSLQLKETLSAVGGAALQTPVSVILSTAIDSTDKFDRIGDEELLTLVQRQTFRYFWDFGHPVSGMARERNTSGDVVTSGGTGFGIMAIVVGIERGFITRQEGHDRVRQIVDFLQAADRYHGAFPHWLNGNTGAVQPFSAKDDGADLLETSLLMQGLLTARAYFDAGGEQSLRDDITALYEAVDWDFFRNGQQQLYWHWSPNVAWEMDLPITGWNEGLIAYVLAAGSPTHGITKETYDMGWARSGAMRNGNSYHGTSLPLGPDGGGPLFFAHYSFLGISPFGLADGYANYEAQVKAHTAINRAHCVANPGGFYGYSADCWGLTASDDISGYLAHSPTNDNGVISPTAALSSFPYMPDAALQALHFFYYKLGDRLWGEYGFKDAFSLEQAWFADSYLAIDQGPIIIMIENHRTGLLWELFMSAPEVRSGLHKLGFSSPNR
ncbi:glucoamylase family protein [Parapedobacter sp. DT-150]|uniref:glucoamylase family protein n=1 Tax=Parapedobacter sp. DT-150 TaxID=3396162 RepID=UPI003F1C89DF